MEHPSPILAYKPQGVEVADIPLPVEGFFLLLMTEFQSQIFAQFSEKVVCLDATHSTNQYRHKLITLMVADDFQNGKQD